MKHSPEDFFSVQTLDDEEEYEASGWNVLDRDLIDARTKRRNSEGIVIGMWDKVGKYWRVSSGVGLVMFTPVEQCVSVGLPRSMSRDNFRKEFC